jgi:hypothetical protein
MAAEHTSLANRRVESATRLPETVAAGASAELPRRYSSATPAPPLQPSRGRLHWQLSRLWHPGDWATPGGRGRGIPAGSVPTWRTRPFFSPHANRRCARVEVDHPIAHWPPRTFPASAPSIHETSGLPRHPPRRARRARRARPRAARRRFIHPDRQPDPGQRRRPPRLAGGSLRLPAAAHLPSCVSCRSYLHKRGSPRTQASSGRSIG